MNAKKSFQTLFKNLTSQVSSPEREEEYSVAYIGSPLLKERGRKG